MCHLAKPIGETTLMTGSLVLYASAFRGCVAGYAKFTILNIIDFTRIWCRETGAEKKDCVLWLKGLHWTETYISREWTILKYNSNFINKTIPGSGRLHWWHFRGGGFDHHSIYSLISFTNWP
jgi:hypothetical protein